jgi:hypothetical protein
MNITLVSTDYKTGEQNFCPLPMEMFALLKQEGIISNKMRVYRLEINHLDVQIECPVIMNEDRRPVCVIMPAFKLPYRRYPSYVYLYAVVLHLTGYSMRKAAEEVRKKFGIKNFSHSTVCRTFATLLLNAESLSQVCNQEAAQYELAQSPVLAERTAWDFGKRKSAGELLRSLGAVLSKPETGTMIIYRYFMRYCQFLL